MSLSYTYNGSALSYNVPPSLLNLPTRAEMGETSIGGIPVEDPEGTLTLVGHKPVTVEEGACSQPRLFTGYTTQRDIGRSYEQTQWVGAEPRVQDMAIADCNLIFDLRLISGTDGNRPDETWDERLAWILGSDYLDGLFGGDTTWIDSHANPMDAADYRGSLPRAVFDDLVNRFEGAMNYFAKWNPSTAAVEIAVFGIDDVTDDCTLKISNVAADIDASTTFAPDMVAKLQREPDQVYSEVLVRYKNGTVFRSRETTATAFIRRGTTIDRPYTGKESTAIAQAEQFLDIHATETDRITCTMQSVPATKVGLIRAGQRMQVKFSHLPGYGDFTWMRIVACTPVPISDVGGHAYDIALELVGPKIVLEECITAVTFSDLETTTSHTQGEGWPSVSITPDAGAECVVIGAAIMSNWNHPADSAWVSGSGYTTLHADFVDGIDAHPFGAVLYKAVPSASGAYTPNGTYTPGYNGATQSYWAMAALTIKSGGSAPVQSHLAHYPEDDPASYDAFPSAPTPGNAILMVASFRDSHEEAGIGDPWPNDGHWVLLGSIETAKLYENYAEDSLGVWVRCVAEGDPNLYGIVPGTLAGYTMISLSEWTATGTADTSDSIGPITVQTTPHTVDPTVTDDGDAGYPTGSTWVNTTSGDVFVSVDATTGAAVWQSTTSPGVTDHGALTGLADDDHTQYVLKRYGGKEVVSTVAATGATETVDLANGNVFDETLTADCTFTFTGATAGVACSFTLLLRQDGTGGWDTTWPGSVVWAGGSAPTLDQTASTVAVLTFFTLDGGTNWYGFPTGGGSAVAALDDLTDVTITSTTDADRLRYNGSLWANSALHWEPMVDYTGLVMLDSGGNPSMHEVAF